MSTVHRIFNFSAGPAVLPLSVLEEARENLLALPGVGMSVLEISHRSKPFEEICYGAEENVKKLAGIPDGYQVLFLQGGATLQFSMIPMNLLAPGSTADFLETGVWAEKAIAEAKKIGGAHVAASSKATNHDRIPGDAEIRWSSSPAYVHMTSNNTIYGTQWHRLPRVPDGVPLVNDASSDIFCRPIDVAATCALPTFFASAIAFSAQTPVSRKSAVPPAGRRFIGIIENCSVAPPWRKSTW